MPSGVYSRKPKVSKPAGDRPRVLSGGYAKCKSYSKGGLLGARRCKLEPHCSYGAARKGQSCRAMPAGKLRKIRVGVALVDGRKRVIYISDKGRQYYQKRVTKGERMGQMKRKYID